MNINNYGYQEAQLLDAAGEHRLKGTAEGRLHRRIAERINKRSNRKSAQPTTNKGFA